jgi:hypothetical protein
MTNITYTATWNGKLIGKRKSPRPYTHAVIVQTDEEVARKFAYDYSATKADRKNFDYYCEIDRLGVDHPHYCIQSWRPAPDHVGIERARANIVGGFDGYVARLKKEAIKSFEAHKAAGGFNPRVAGWSMSERNAHKMAQQHSNGVHSHFLGLVPAIPKS